MRRLLPAHGWSVGARAASAVSAVTRRLYFARRYRSRLDWVASYYDAVVRAVPASPWLGRGALLSVRLKALPEPVYVRLGSSDWFVLEEVFLRDVYAEVQKLVGEQPEAIVDLGANIGLTLRLWHAYWPSAPMLAVEPDGDNLRLLQRNVESAAMAEQVRIVRACAVGTARSVHLDRSHAAAAYRMTDKPRGQLIAGRTVSDLLDGAGFARVGLLKCDIEGAERELFERCADWIARVRVLAVEVHGGYTAELLERDIRANGGDFERIATQDPSIVVLRSRLARA